MLLSEAAIGQLDFDQAIGTGRNQLLGTLQIHDVHVVLAHVLLKRRRPSSGLRFPAQK